MAYQPTPFGKSQYIPHVMQENPTPSCDQPGAPWYPQENPKLDGPVYRWNEYNRFDGLAHNTAESMTSGSVNPGHRTFSDMAGPASQITKSMILDANMFKDNIRQQLSRQPVKNGYDSFMGMRPPLPRHKGPSGFQMNLASNGPMGEHPDQTMGLPSVSCGADRFYHQPSLYQ